MLQHWQDAPEANKPALQSAVVEALNQMIVADFGWLLQLLYTVDVSEQKLKTVLQNHPQTDAAELIAGLLFSRLAEKWASRQQHRAAPPDATDAERW